MSGGIFVSYRKTHNGVRRPHALTIAAIADRLRHHFGEDKVLIDMDLAAGDHYPSKLRGWLRGCEVMLVVVHREWFDDLEARRGEQWDWARWEVETALDMGLHVLPVLLDDATLPGKDELKVAGFPDLAEIATRQYWRLSFPGWKQELSELLRVLEVRVATAQLPPAERKEPVRRKWFWFELAAAAVIGLLAPAALARFPVGGEPVDFLTALAIALNVFTFVPFAIAVLELSARTWLDRQDRRFAETAHDTRTNAIVGLTIAGLGVLVLFGSRMLPDDAIVPALAALALIIAVPGHKWLHDRRDDLWPYDDLSPRPGAARAALAHVGRFLAQRDLLTRVERDQVEFVLGQVEWARQQMDAHSRLGRVAWFRQVSIRLVAAHLLLSCMVLGSALFAVVEGSPQYYAPYLVGPVAAAVFFYFGAIELTFRHQRWRLRTVVTAIPGDVARLRVRLAEISIPPAALQEVTE